MLGITKEDFTLRADRFALSNPWNLLRVLAGALMFPHVAGKFAGWAGTVGFFEKAGFAPGNLWVGLAAFSEASVGIALVFGICTRFAALGGASVLAIAVYALMKANSAGWLWNKGGVEYPFFWAMVCLAIAINEFNRISVQTSKR